MRRGTPRSRTYAVLLAAVAVLSIGVGMALYAGRVSHELELGTVDSRFSIRGAEDPRDDIVLVVIDDVTSDELNIRYPYPRSLHARVIDQLNRAGAAAIAYDVEFLEPTSFREDNALINAVARAGPDRVVLADSQPNEFGESGVFGGQEVLDDIGARAGNAQLGEDSDGVLRRMPFEVGGMKTFPIVTAEMVRGEELTEEDMGGPSAWIDFAGPARSYPSFSFSKVMRGEVPPEALTDKIVVIGASDPRLKDIRPTSTTDEEPMAGPEAEANGIATALEDFPLQSAPLGLDLLLIVLIGMVVPVASFQFSPMRALALAIAVGALYLLAAQLAFSAGLIIPVVYPMAALALSIVGSLIVYYLLETLERQRVRDTFARFVPAEVVSDVLARTDEDLRLGGRRMVVTVLFSDIRSFTTFSETRPPEEVVGMLNRYHEEMTEAVMGNGGALIAFVGDGIMAVFGAPIERADHADRAFAAAREMLEVRLPRVNDWMREQDSDTQFKIGIGLNSGPVMAGNVGSKRRMEYTAIGDTVNTAARLEGMTKGTPHDLFVSESTRELLSDDSDLVFVESMPVRGRSQTIGVWALATPGEAGPGDGAGPGASESAEAGAPESV